MNRETWLAHLVSKLHQHVFAPKGYTLPTGLKCSVGFPIREKGGQVVAQCHPPKSSTGGFHEIFISPRVDSTEEVAHTIAHEICHAIVGTEHGHAGPFRQIIRRIGLTGKPTATEAGPEFTRNMAEALKELGPYPHMKMTPGIGNIKKAPTRLLKAFCTECGYTIRITRLWADAGLPMCPNIDCTLSNNERLELEAKEG